MKNSNSTFLVWFSLGMFFLMLFNHANAENITEPRGNVNLSPFESWRSAYYCMLNHSKTCVGKTNYTISLDGLLIVQDTEINDFCTRGCYEHTLYVFTCIQEVKRDFTFKTKAPLSYVKKVTHDACIGLKKGFNTSYTDPNSATSLLGRFYMPLVSTVMTMAFLATFSV